MAHESYKILPPCAADCICRTASRETPVADLVYGMGELRSLPEQPADARSLSEQFLAAFDQMQEFHHAEARRRASVGTDSASTPTPASGAGSVLASSTPGRRKRRTKEQMQAARAAKAQAIKESYDALVPEAHWLAEPDESMDALLEEMRHEDS